MNLVSEINSTGLYATVGKNYIYEDASGNDAVEPISALRAKQDALIFTGDNNKITAINNSAIGGTDYTSGLDIKIDNGVISVNAKDCDVNNTGYCIAIGVETTAAGQHTFSYGSGTSAGGDQSLAGGKKTSANGEQSIALGSSTSAGGNQTFAGGLHTTATGDQAFVFGNNLTAGDNQFVIGKYSEMPPRIANAMFIVGNGTSTSNKSNAFIVYEDGYVTAKGDMGVTYSDGDNSYQYDVGHSIHDLSADVFDLKTASSNWDDAYTAVTGNSGDWNNVVTSVSNYSSNWDNTYNTLYNNSASWTGVVDTVSNNSSTNWENVITGITVDNGTQISPVNKVVNIDLSGKVDKEPNKGLSTNDYVNSAKDVVDLAYEVIPSDASTGNKLVTSGTVAAALANVGHFEIVGLDANDEPDVQNPSTKIFYLTRSSSADPDDPYTEWIYTESDDPTPVTAWNIIGSTQIDLHGYAKLPSTYTEDHIIAFGSSYTVKDTGVTTAQIGGSISGIKLNGGNELSIVDKVINIPTATNTNNVGTDGIMAGADKVKLDNILTAYASDGYLSLSTANQTVTYGLNVTTGTYSNTDIITQIGGSSLSAYIADSANSAANSNKLNGQQAGYYCSDSNARIYSNFAGGNGITVAGELTQTKTINSNLTEYQLQEGVGITFEVDDVNETVKFHAKPEIFLYYTTAPIMASNTAIAFSTTSAAYNSKSGTVGINNSEITGLDTTKLYHCNVKLIVENVDSTPATVSVKATNWNNNDSITYEYVNANNTGTMELDWYIKGLTGCALTGGGLSTDIQAGVKEIMIAEVCYA